MILCPYILFKSGRVEVEWKTATWEHGEKPIVHPALYVITIASARWYYLHTGEPATVTHILRTRREQQRFYPDEPNKRSVHEYGRGLDLRAKGVSAELGFEWESWINKTFDYRGKRGCNTALYHNIEGGVIHNHLQVGPRERRPGWPDEYRGFLTALLEGGDHGTGDNLHG